MSKGLDALQDIRLRLFIESEVQSKKVIKDLKTIEEELKDYEMEHTLRIRLENINYELVREKQENENKLKALDIIKKHLRIAKPFDLETKKEEPFEIFDLDLWNDGKQKEDFEFVRKVLEL